MKILRPGTVHHLPFFWEWRTVSYSTHIFSNPLVHIWRLWVLTYPSKWNCIQPIIMLILVRSYSFEKRVTIMQMRVIISWQQLLYVSRYISKDYLNEFEFLLYIIYRMLWCLIFFFFFHLKHCVDHFLMCSSELHFSFFKFVAWCETCSLQVFPVSLSLRYTLVWLQNFQSWCKSTANVLCSNMYSSVPLYWKEEMFISESYRWAFCLSRALFLNMLLLPCITVMNHIALILCITTKSSFISFQVSSVCWYWDILLLWWVKILFRFSYNAYVLQ